ncbi:MAG: Nif3-like dinuclear metal center hexameric protein, partial [Algicola sp.]|nr:Nif3-like dinuclear metal center hexameric protein [Algicola sp.]
MSIQDVINYLEALAPLAYAEDFDNVGLLVGDKTKSLTGVLVTLDTLEEVVDEAIANNCNLIVSFHPIVFKGLKSITGKDYVERTVLKAIKNDIAIYAIHTALDNAPLGVNHAICEKLGLVNNRILIPQKNSLKKLITFVPNKAAESVRKALFSAGAGSIGNYSNCSFNTEGYGTFMGNDAATPSVGNKNQLHTEAETQIAVIFEKHQQRQILKALFNAHPYEEVAYDIITLDNDNQNTGMGMIGELEQPMDEAHFLTFLKNRMNTRCIRHSKLLGKPIKKIAVLGGSGSFAIQAAKAQQADAYVTADLKYHDFFSANNDILLADVGHFESEQYTKNLLTTYLTKKITNFAVVLSKTNT